MDPGKQPNPGANRPERPQGTFPPMPQLREQTSDRVRPLVAERSTGDRTLGRHSRAGESGFTLVEIMVAIIVLLIGVLGSVALVDAANRTTSTTRAREAGTNLARSVLEAARSLPYTSLVQATAPGDIHVDPGLPASDASTAACQLTQRRMTYPITFTYSCT